MSALRWQGIVSGMALAASTARTVLQVVAPANQKLYLAKLSGGFYGVSGTDNPVRVRVLKQTTAGTGRATLTLTKRNSQQTETLQATATVWQASATEPTAGEVLLQLPIHPQGNFVLSLLDDQGNPLVLNGGERLGIEVLPGANPSGGLTMDLTLEAAE